MFQRLAVRDTLLIILSVSAWMQLAPLGDASAAAGWTAGLALALVAYVAHEWGHALAAMAARSAIYAPRTLLHVSLFSFDARANSVRQFMLMSLGGFAVTGVAVLMAHFVLPADELAGRVARGGIFVLASITLFVEVPLLLYGLARGRIPAVVAVFRAGPETRSR
jgi:hypothetical protein